MLKKAMVFVDILKHAQTKYTVQGNLNFMLVYTFFYLQFLGEMIIIQTKHPPAFLGQL